MHVLSMPYHIPNVYKLHKGDHVIKKCVLVRLMSFRIMKNAEEKSPLTKIEEDMKMALTDLFGWSRREAPAACGAADKPEEKPAACGAAETPAACGAAEAPAACGASDKPEEKPAACGSACGAGDN